MKFPIWWESHSKFHGSKPPSSSCFFHQPVVAMIMIYTYFLIFKSNMMKNHGSLHELLSILSTSSWCLHCPQKTPRKIRAASLLNGTFTLQDLKESPGIGDLRAGHRFTDGDFLQGFCSRDDQKRAVGMIDTMRHPPNISPNIPGVTRLLAFLSATGFFRFFLNPAG